MRGNRFGYFSLGLLAGIAVGAVGGLLMAPASGPSTRRVIKRRLLQGADLARGFAERAEWAAEAVGERFDHYLGRDEEAAKRKVRELREGVDRYSQSHTPDVSAAR